MSSSVASSVCAGTSTLCSSVRRLDLPYRYFKQPSVWATFPTVCLYTWKQKLIHKNKYAFKWLQY